MGNRDGEMDGAAFVAPAMEYTELNDISELLKQFEALTSIWAATVSGAAKVMSTHENKLAP